MAFKTKTEFCLRDSNMCVSRILSVCFSGPAKSCDLSQN